MSSLKELCCPRCGREAVAGVLPQIVAAMELQAKRHGVEVECRHCTHRFLHHGMGTGTTGGTENAGQGRSASAEADG